MITRFASRVAQVLDDMRYAQRRLVVLAAAPDRFVTGSDQAPGDYAEFLFRTSGPLFSEPSAADRESGRLVH
jgi:hypothetical protein